MKLTSDHTTVKLTPRTAAGSRVAASVRESFQVVQQKIKDLDQAVVNLKNQIDRTWPN